MQLWEEKSDMCLSMRTMIKKKTVTGKWEWSCRALGANYLTIFFFHFLEKRINTITSIHIIMALAHLQIYIDFEEIVFSVLKYDHFLHDHLNSTAYHIIEVGLTFYLSMHVISMSRPRNIRVSKYQGKYIYIPRRRLVVNGRRKKHNNVRSTRWMYFGQIYSTHTHTLTHTPSVKLICFYESVLCEQRNLQHRSPSNLTLYIFLKSIRNSQNE